MSDLINRQDAIYALTEANLKSHMDSVEGGQENRSAIRIIMELPSADRKRGKWVHYDECDFDYDYKCSLCGYAVWNNSDYCPGCGAVMRGKENE